MASRKSTFELRIGIVGGSQAGKTTTLNAILRDDYAGAIASKRKNSPAAVIGCNTIVTGKGASNRENGDNVDLKLSSTDNVKLKENGEQVNEVVYEVEIEEPIVPTRDDTSITFLIIPDGENSKHYMTQKWDSFDALLYVVDSKKGVSDEDMLLFKFLKERSEERTIPVIILFNKIDEKDEGKIAKHAKKAIGKIEKVYGPKPEDDDEEEEEEEDGEKKVPFPSFVSVSSLHGYIYRAGNRMTINQYESFDKSYMDIIGKEHLGGKKYKKLSQEEKVSKTHEILADKKYYDEGMKDTGYAEFMNTFEKYLGGNDIQSNILQKQVDVSLKNLSPFQADWISYTIFSAYQKQNKLIAGKTDIDEDLVQGLSLRNAFWDTYAKYQDGMQTKFVNAFPDKINLIFDPLQELMYYHKLVVLAKWDGEEEKVVEQMKLWLKRYLHFLITHEQETNGNTIWKANSNMSPIDWSIVWRSILMLSYDRKFCETFTREKLIIEKLALKADAWEANGFPGSESHCPHCTNELENTKKDPVVPKCKDCMTVFLPEDEIEEDTVCHYCGNGEIGEEYQCGNCKYKHEAMPNISSWVSFTYNDELEIVPTDEEKYKKVIHLDVPESLNDINNFAHPIYKFLEFVETLKGNNKQNATNNDEKNSNETN